MIVTAPTFCVTIKIVPFTVLLSVHFSFVAVCLAQNVDRNRYDSAVIGGIGGLGGNFQQTPFGMTGGTWATGTHTSAYSVGYRQQLSRALSGSVTYVNHGHYDRHGYRTDHHSRDDIQVDLSIGKRPNRGPLEFRIAGGGAYYSETDHTGEGGDDFQNRQGFGGVISGVLDVDLSNRLFIEGRVDRHFVLDRYDSMNALAGLGFRLQGRDPAAVSPSPGASKHAIRINYGMGRLNSKQSETLRRAFQVAHEMDLSPRFALASSYLSEGRAPELNRKGFAIQGEARQELGGFFTLGLGLGPYINVDHSDFFQRKGRMSVDALFTAFLDVRVAKQLELSFSTSRPRALGTLKNKPMTDVFQTGLKFRL